MVGLATRLRLVARCGALMPQCERQGSLLRSYHRACKLAAVVCDMHRAIAMRDRRWPGVVGGVAAASTSGVVLTAWGVDVSGFLAKAGGSGLAKALFAWPLIALLLLLAIVFVTGLLAVRDALGERRGEAAGRLWLIYGLASVIWAASGSALATAILCSITASNLLAWLSRRPCPRSN